MPLIIRAWGMDPEKLLSREAFANGAITNQDGLVNRQLTILGQELKSG